MRIVLASINLSLPPLQEVDKRVYEGNTTYFISDLR